MVVKLGHNVRPVHNWSIMGHSGWVGLHLRKQPLLRHWCTSFGLMLLQLHNLSHAALCRSSASLRMKWKITIKSLSPHGTEISLYMCSLKYMCWCEEQLHYPVALPWTWTACMLWPSLIYNGRTNSHAAVGGTSCSTSDHRLPED